MRRRDRSIKTRPMTRRWRSSGRCSRRAPTSMPPGSRTPVLAGRAGSRRCAAGGGAGSLMRGGTTSGLHSRPGGPEDARGPVAGQDRRVPRRQSRAARRRPGQAARLDRCGRLPEHLSRRNDVAELTAGYGLIVADECHHVPAAAFEHAVKQIPARRWLGLTATPYRRDKLDDLIAMQVGPVRHTIAFSRNAAGQDTLLGTGRPAPVLYVHPTAYRYVGDADPSRPGGMTTIYRHLAADEQRARQVIADVLAALSKDRNCLILTNRTSHLEKFAGLLRGAGHDPVILRGGWVPGAARRRWPACRGSPAGRRSWPWPPARTLAKASTARPWIPCSWPRRSPIRAA